MPPNPAQPPVPVAPGPPASGTFLCTDCITQYLAGTLQAAIGVTVCQVAIAWYTSPATGRDGYMCWLHITGVTPAVVP